MFNSLYIFFNSTCSFTTLNLCWCLKSVLNLLNLNVILRLLYYVSIQSDTINLFSFLECNRLGWKQSRSVTKELQMLSKGYCLVTLACVFTACIASIKNGNKVSIELNACSTWTIKHIYLRCLSSFLSQDHAEELTVTSCNRVNYSLGLCFLPLLCKRNVKVDKPWWQCYF